MKRKEPGSDKMTLLRMALRLTLAIAFLAASLSQIPRTSITVLADSIPSGAFNPDTYQGTIYTVHGNSGSYTTSEVEKLYTNVFYYKDKIVVEDKDINAHGTGAGGDAFTFNLVAYDPSEETIGGFATLRVLEDKNIVRITKGEGLDDTFGDKLKGKSTISMIEFINPDYIVKLTSSRSDSSHPSWGGQTTVDGKTYRGIVSFVDHVAVYAASCDITYSYNGDEKDYLWQDGVKSHLPDKLYAPMPSGSYKFTIPLPVGSRGYADFNDDMSQTSNYDRFGAIADISYNSADSSTYLTERIGTVSPSSYFYDNALQGSTYSSGNLQILGSGMNVEFYTYDGAAVVFHQNGGKIEGISEGSDYYMVPVRFPVTYTQAQIDALVSAPTRNGYKFVGWAFKDSYSYDKIEFENYAEVQTGYYQATSYKYLGLTPPIILEMYALWTAEGSESQADQDKQPGKTDPTDQTTQADLGKVGTVTVKDQVYTGKALKPAVTVKAGKTKLVKGTDYVVSYSKNKNIGTATVTVKGKGNYTGTLKKTFKINPKPTTMTGITAGTKQLIAIWKKGSGVTGYEIEYSLNKKFTKKSTKVATVNKGKTVKKVIKKLKTGKTYYVRVRTYKTVGKEKYYSAWTKMKTVKVK